MPDAWTRPAGSRHRHRVPTLAERWSPTANSFGLARIVFAFGVLVAHAGPLGFGSANIGDSWTAHQTDVGNVSLDCLLVVAGFLNADSALRYTAREYTWRRVIRIAPGLWTCLVVTAFVLAPIAAIYENGNLHGFVGHTDGPFQYVRDNVLAGFDRFSISGLLTDTPWGRLTGGPGAFDGSLWTLRYEFGAYAVLGVLLAVGVLRRAPQVVLAIVALGYAMILRDGFRAGSWTIRPPAQGTFRLLPMLGTFEVDWVLYLGFLFMLGVALRLYMHRVPMSRVHAVAALAVVLLTMRHGGWLAVGLPLTAYLLIYAVVEAPACLQRIGRRRDYSFGIYIYAFPVEQLVALFGGNRWGLGPYIALSATGALVLAVLSWHLVERPPLRLKDHPPSTWRHADRVIRPVVTMADKIPAE